jgi:transposase-like protein
LHSVTSDERDAQDVASWHWQGAQAASYSLDVVVLCVRWHVAYSLRLRNLEEIMAEQGIEVAHSSVPRWVIKLVPVFEKGFSTAQETGWQAQVVSSALV